MIHALLDTKVLTNKDVYRIDALTAVLKALSYQLSIQPIAPENPNLETISRTK